MEVYGKTVKLKGVLCESSIWDYLYYNCFIVYLKNIYRLQNWNKSKDLIKQ